MAVNNAAVTPAILVIMGVSGSGKSRIAALLAARLGWPFVEGDALHSPANIAKMAANIPLNDEDRAPWLAAIAAQVSVWSTAGQAGILTCSALRHVYRRQIAEAAQSLLVKFVYLRGTAALLHQRLEKRQGHFMPPALLPSQLAALEEPGADENTLTVDIGAPPEEITGQIIAALTAAPSA